MPLALDRLLGVVSGNGDRGAVPVGDGLRLLTNNILESCHQDTVAPTVNEDADDGYKIGSLWVNTVTNIVYICVDTTPGAAIWWSFATGFESDSMFQAGVRNVQNNQTQLASYAMGEAIGGLVMHRSGQLVSLGAAMSSGQTQGTCTVQVLKNGVVQPETLVIDAANPITNFYEFITPVEFVQGDLMQVQTVTSGYSPNNDDISVSLFYRNYTI